MKKDLKEKEKQEKRRHNEWKNIFEKFDSLQDVFNRNALEVRV